jgi:hypothetical protein
MRAVLKAQINKTDRNDARGIAQMMRVGLYRPVHVRRSGHSIMAKHCQDPPSMRRQKCSLSGAANYATNQTNKLLGAK